MRLLVHRLHQQSHKSMCSACLLLLWAVLLIQMEHDLISSTLSEGCQEIYKEFYSDQAIYWKRFFRNSNTYGSCCQSQLLLCCLFSCVTLHVLGGWDTDRFTYVSLQCFVKAMLWLQAQISSFVIQEYPVTSEKSYRNGEGVLDSSSLSKYSEIINELVVQEVIS